MNKKGIVMTIVTVPVISGVMSLSLSSSNSETVNLDVENSHDAISTAMSFPILDDPNTPVTIVEFGDFQCHQYYNWFHDTKHTITSDYLDTGKANLIFVDLAFLEKDSTMVAQASYYAEDQGLCWQYPDVLYASQESTIDDGWVNSEQLKAFAFSLGLDMKLFEICLDSGKYSKRVQYNVQPARDPDVMGTTGFFIVGSDGHQQQISSEQSLSVFKQILDSMV